MKIMASGPNTSWQIDDGNSDWLCWGSKITADGDCSREIKRHFLLGRKAMTNLVSSLQSLSHVWLFANPWTAARQASLSITNSWSPPKPMSIELVMPSKRSQRSSYPLSSPSPPVLNLSQYQGLFQWVSSSHQWPKYWSFSFNISPSNEYLGLISFKMDWLDLLAVQGTLQESSTP